MPGAHLSLHDLLTTWSGFTAQPPPPHPTKLPWRARIVGFADGAGLWLWGVCPPTLDAADRHHAWWYADLGTTLPLAPSAQDLGHAVQAGMVQAKPDTLTQTVVARFETRDQGRRRAHHIVLDLGRPIRPRHLTTEGASARIHDLEGQLLRPELVATLIATTTRDG